MLSIFGSDFVAGYAALVVLAGAQLLDSTAASVSSCLAMTKYQRFNVLNILVMAVVSVALNVILIPRMGILGAGIATGTAIALVNVARLIEGRALLGVSPFDRSSLRLVATAAILLALAYAVRRLLAVPTEWYWSALTLVIAYGICAAATVLMGLSDEDRAIWRSVADRALGRPKYRGGSV